MHRSDASVEVVQMWRTSDPKSLAKLPRPLFMQATETRRNVRSFIHSWDPAGHPNNQHHPTTWWTAGDRNVLCHEVTEALPIIPPIHDTRQLRPITYCLHPVYVQTKGRIWHLDKAGSPSILCFNITQEKGHLDGETILMLYYIECEASKQKYVSVLKLNIPVTSEKERKRENRQNRGIQF